MKDKKSVIAAISGAITAYMQEEEGVLAARRLPPANLLFNLWGLAGRQEIMNRRQLWQLRIVRPR